MKSGPTEHKKLNVLAPIGDQGVTMSACLSVRQVYKLWMTSSSLINQEHYKSITIRFTTVGA